MNGSIFAIILLTTSIVATAWCAVQAQPDRPRYVPPMTETVNQCLCLRSCCHGECPCK
jgi:hypothetical protein